MAKQPNVLFVITDQHRADHTAFMGNEIVRTPALDSIADRGMVFENAWVSNPVCMPNRSTIMTGRMPTAHGVIFNDRSLEWTANTFPRMLRTAGYRTALIGKSHLQHGMSRNSVFEAHREPVAQTPYPDLWDNLEDFERYMNGAVDDPDDFYGFDHIELSIDHGARVTGHHLQWALEKGGNIDELFVPYSGESPALDRSERWWQIYRAPYDPALHSTSFVTDRSIAFIEEASGQDKPWLAFASFPDPHHPYVAPGDWFDRHHADDMPLSPSIDDPMEHGLSHLRRTQRFTADQQRSWVGAIGASDHQMVREATAATYGMIEMVDDGVGKILAAIEAAGQTENTIVIFTSDHGDMMGDHGLMMKGYMPYNGTQRVAMVVAAPGHEPGRSASLASSLDLAPTILDLCGVEAFDGVQGTSLRPVLGDAAATPSDRVLIEDDCPAPLANRVGFPVKTRTVVTDDLKYTRLDNGEEMLFDLAADPEEVNNLAPVDPVRRAAAVEQMMEALLAADDMARGAPVA